MNFNLDEIQLGLDDGGNAIVVFQYGPDIASMSFDSITELWSSAEVREPEATGSTGPTLGVMPNGGAHVIWTQAVSEKPDQIWSTTFDGGSWATPFVQHEVLLGATPASNPTLAIDYSGRAHSVWFQNTETRAVVNSRTRASGAVSWTSLTPIRLVADASASQPRLVPFGADSVLAFYHQQLDDDTESIEALAKVGMLAWDVLPPLASSDSMTVTLLGAAGSKSGDVMAVFSVGGAVAFARFRDGAWEDLGPFLTEDVDELELVMDDEGNCTAAWMNSIGELQASYWAATSTDWSEADLLSPSMLGSLDLAIDGLGNVTAVWLAFDDGIASVASSRVRAGETTWSPAAFLEEVGS